MASNSIGIRQKASDGLTSQQIDEHTRLLHGQANDNTSHEDEDENDAEELDFNEDDEGNPKQWPLSRKYTQVILIFFIGLICPMASSILAPGMSDIAETFNVDSQIVIGAQTGFVCMLGIGPLFLAPMSETFGRRTIFLTNLIIFTLIQIPTALAPNIESFMVLRTLGGLFGSVGVANGGGSISDMFVTEERATVLGFYLLGPLLGPTLGPLFGGLILTDLDWRWMFWVVFILVAILTILCVCFLHETCAPIVLQNRKKQLEKENADKKYKIKGQSDMGILQKIKGNSTRATKILFYQPIVLTMSAWQALVFSSMYSLYANYTKVWSSPPYNFDTKQVALSYIAPASGFILTAFLVVPFIDRIYKRLAKKLNNGEGKPEYRLPLANIGAVFLPCSLFWFGWTVEYEYNWPIPLLSMLLFGGSQVSIFNSVQNYYIDSFESQAASALAAGAFLRSITGGIIPLFTPQMFESIGYGWGMSVFGIIGVVLMPAPLLFFRYGGTLREKFAIDS